MASYTQQTTTTQQPQQQQQYTQSYVVAPATGTQQYAQPVAAYDPNAYAPVTVQPYQPAPQYAPAYAPAYNPDELRTVFVTGFPEDVKDREVRNMCRFMPGYEVRPSSRLAG
jgi:hypothetical protein